MKKEVVCLGVMCCLKFVKERKHFVDGKNCVAVV
jgi:hypothetical protein